MVAKIQKWGNSLGVRIPKSFAEEAGIAEGSPVDVLLDRGRIVIRPLRAKRYRLQQLLGGVTAANRHSAISTGDAVGREAW